MFYLRVVFLRLLENLSHIFYLLQKASPGSRFWHRRKQSIQIDNNILKDEFSQITDPQIGDADVQLDSDIISVADSSLQVQDAHQIKQNEIVEWASTHIQTAFRGFLV